MTEHEKLKAICDKIGYDYWNDWHEDKHEFWYEYWSEWYYIFYNVREIIFTQEFMNKFEDYYYKEISDGEDYDYDLLTLVKSELDNPVDYLYSLLF